MNSTASRPLRRVGACALAATLVEFDPHEPFDTPEPWASRHDPEWDEPRIIWPPYSTATVASGVLTPRQAAHIRANYGAKLSMIDHWFGGILDTFDSRSDRALLRDWFPLTMGEMIEVDGGS